MNENKYIEIFVFRINLLFSIKNIENKPIKADKAAKLFDL